MRHARTDYNRIQDPQNLIPEAEPVFLLRGQDAIAYQVVGLYANLLESYGGAPALISSIRGQAHRMADWSPHSMPDVPAECLVGSPVATPVATPPPEDPRSDSDLAMLAPPEGSGHGPGPRPEGSEEPEAQEEHERKGDVMAGLAEDTSTSNFPLPPEAQARVNAALDLAKGQSETVTVDLPDSAIEPVKEVEATVTGDMVEVTEDPGEVPAAETDPLDDLLDLNDPKPEEEPSSG